MNKNLQDYVLKFPNVLDNFLCDTLLNEVEQIKWKVNTFYNHQTKTHKSVSDGKDLDTEPYRFFKIDTKNLSVHYRDRGKWRVWFLLAF